METNEAAIDTFWNGQLYTVLGQPDPSGGWQLRLWWKPFVTLIWPGGALIAFGGALALLGRIWRRAPAPRAEWRRALCVKSAARFVPLDPALLAGRALVWRLATPADTAIQSQLVKEPVPAFALPAALPGKPGLTTADLATGRPSGQHVRQLVRAVHRGGLGACATLKRAVSTIDGIAVRDRPADLAAFLARHGDPYRAHRRATPQPDANCARLVGSAGELRRRWPGVIRHQYIGRSSEANLPTSSTQLEAGSE